MIKLAQYFRTQANLVNPCTLLNVDIVVEMSIEVGLDNEADNHQNNHKLQPMDECLVDGMEETHEADAPASGKDGSEHARTG